MNFNKKSNFTTFSALILTGIIGGTINSLIGTGGGIAVVFALSEIYAENKEYNTKDIFATSLISMFFMSLLSCVLYLKNGTFRINDALIYVPFAAVGGVLGAILLEKFNSSLTKKIFGALVLYAGASMLFK